MFSSDYEDLFSTLDAYRIKCLVVGAHAVAVHAQPRFTKDLDVWIPPALNDSRRVYQALKAYGAPLRDLMAESFAESDLVLQIGVAPVRIDIMMSVPGLVAQEAWKRRVKTKYGNAVIHVLGLSDVIQSKRTAGRPQDKFDLAKLLKRKRSGYR